MNTLDLLFSWFIFATVRGTLLALGVLALQAALRGRMPARWRYALWLPVVLVLAAPWLPQSRWSLENRFAPAVARVEPAPLASAFEGTLLTDVPPLAVVPAARTDWRHLAQVAWLAGAVGVLVLALAAYARTVRRMRRGEVPAEAALVAMISETALASGLRGAPRLLVSSAVESPAVTGFWSPLLLLPASFPGAFTHAEARLVLLHELAHLKRGDLPLNWLLCLLQAIHWCNPVLWFVFARMRADREAACDARVLTLTGADSRAAYGHALLKLEGSLTHPGLSLGFVGIFERTAGMRARVRAIAAHRRAHPAWGVLGAGLIGALTAVGATRAESPPLIPAAATPQPRTDAASARLRQKLNAIIIPRLEFREATIKEALDFLKQKSIELDTEEPDAAKRGVNIILNLAAPLDPSAEKAVPPNPTDARVTVALTNIPLIEALRYVTSLANLKFRMDANAVEVVPLNALIPFVRKEWKITPATPDLGSNPQESLIAAGISFPPGSAAARSEDGSRLIMLNSPENLDLVDAFLTEPGTPEPEVADPRKMITQKLNTIIIPQLDLRSATLREAVDFLKKKSVELDTAEPDPAKRGVNMVLKLGEAPVAPAAVPGLAPSVSTFDGNPVHLGGLVREEPRITVSLRNIPLMEALRYVTGLAQMKFRVEPFTVSIMPVNAGTGVLITKEFKVDVRSINALGLARNPDPKAAIAEKGVSFPAGAAAFWNPDLKRLVIRNTQENLDAVERLLDAGR